MAEQFTKATAMSSNNLHYDLTLTAGKGDLLNMLMRSPTTAFRLQLGHWAALM